MPRISSALTLVTLSMAGAASALSSCVAFDISWNLLAFGFNGKDYNAGQQSTWGSGSATDITTTGRPPFDGANTTCFLSEYTNAIYVLGADSSSPSSIYIYDATALSWTEQQVETGNFNPSNFDAILDHDTNVFYALSSGEMYNLDMGLLKAANSTPLSWNDVESSGFGASYQPVMALAQNHIHFLDVPGDPAGSATIFVIHYSYMQPTPQAYGNFPATHGQATSFFMDTGVQQEFAFIPDDGSATYVINVETNTTQTLAGPTIKDSLATYFASTNSLVQLSSSGTVSYLPYTPGDNATNAAATWATVQTLPVATSASSNSTTASAGTGGSTASGSASGSNTAKGAVATGTSSGSSNGALSMSPSTKWGVSGLVAFAFASFFL